jgi:hypothetical protein
MLESQFILAGYSTRREVVCGVDRFLIHPKKTKVANSSSPHRFGQRGCGRIDLVVSACDVTALIEVKAHGWPSLGTHSELLARTACVDNTQPAAQVSSPP